MAHSRARQLLTVFAVASAACAREATSPAGPSAPPHEQTEPGESRLLLESSGTKPPGFVASVLSDPKRNGDGVIEATSPVTVVYDACRSRSGDSSALGFYFDWDSDHVADVVGTGDTCLQRHTYRIAAEDDGRGDATFRTNVCVTAATYVSCREFTIALSRAEAEPCAGPQPDRFTNLTAIHEVISPDLGNVTANDCPPETVLNGSAPTPFINVTSLFIGTDGDVSLICTAAGSFSGTFFYQVPSGQAEVFLSGDCT